MFYVLLTIILLDFVIGRVLSVLNGTYDKKPVPEEIKDIYTDDKRVRQCEFNRANRKFSWISNTFDTLVIVLMFTLGGYTLLDHFTHEWVEMITNPIARDIAMAAIFFLFLSIASEFLHIPFGIYRTFNIMAKFGFNRTTPKTFTLDILKQTGLNILLTTIIFAAIVPIYDTIPDYFWLVAWAVMSGFSLFMSYFYSQLIVPIFNKQTPLPDGELRTAIEQFAGKTQFNLKDIYVMDSSRRSTIANAYFTGFGKRKRIVLYDTLIQQLTTDEIVAVLAHEIGHYRHHHTIISIFTSLATSLLTFFLMGLTLKYNLCAGAIGCVASFHVNMYFFYTLYDPIDTIISLGSNAISRRHEYQADAFARENGYAEQQISALKKLSANSLSNPTPHPLFVFFHYSHPTLVDRIKSLRKI